MRKISLSLKAIFINLVLINFILMAAVPVSSAQVRADTIVIVNSNSPFFSDFEKFIKPYVKHFGLPYRLLDVASQSISTDINNYALIIVGHRLLDPTGGSVSSAESANITAAIQSGVGIVNFDNQLTISGTIPRYQFIQDIFGFGYGGVANGTGISFPGGVAHYITEGHSGGSTISTGSMTLAGIKTFQNVTTVANCGTQPFLAVKSFGNGRAVQWGSYDWMSYTVKGPMYGIDDLIWRSFVWAARKPFVIRGLPPFVTMRVDDEGGGFEWIRIANEFGIKPWAGLFYKDIDPNEAVELSNLVNQGLATVSIHAKDNATFFYYNHGAGGDYQNNIIDSNFADGTYWHQLYNIPISKFALPHYYEFGKNVFQGLDGWGVEFVGTVMRPGDSYRSPWLLNGPFRFFEAGDSGSTDPLFYADFLDIPSHPELDGIFFNCLTEIRDDAGYEWYPDLKDVSGSISRGTRQVQRALDAMALATLFTHSQYVSGSWNSNAGASWRLILKGITENIIQYNPIYVTMDYACQYLRSIQTSYISSATYDQTTNRINVNLSGDSDLETLLYVFNEGETVTTIAAPVFSGGIQVSFGATQRALDHFEFLSVSSPQSAGAPFVVTIRALDAAGNLFSSYTGTAVLSDTTGSVSPVAVGPFSGGIWSGQVTVGVAAASVMLSASSGTVSGASNAFAVQAAPTGSSYSIWDSGAIPAIPYISDSPVELGVKFRPTANGYLTALRFYRGAANPGTVFVGHLWTASGTLLAEVTFPTGTPAGWQQVNLAQPVAVSAETTYVASYHTSSGYAVSRSYFTSSNTSAYTGSVLYALTDGVEGGNGVYLYGASRSFPTNTYQSGNYWADVIFSIDSSPAISTISRTPSSLSNSATVGNNALSQSFQVSNSGGGTLNYTISDDASWLSCSPVSGTSTGELDAIAVSYSTSGLAVGTYTATISITASGASNSPQTVPVTLTVNAASSSPVISRTPASLSTSTTQGANASSQSFQVSNSGGGTLNYTISAAASWLFCSPASGTSTGELDTISVSYSTSGLSVGTYTTTITIAAPGAGNSPQTIPVTLTVGASSIWNSEPIPAIPYHSDSSSVELGVKFRAVADGYLTALRFYRDAANPGTVFVGHLWTDSGTLLAEATFPTGTVAGWQQVNLAQPVAVSAETTYIASYHTSSGYAVNRSYFTSANTSAYTGSELYALTDGVDGGNGVYLYGASRSFPTNTYQSGNYWMDVVFAPGSVPTPALDHFEFLSVSSPQSAGAPFVVTIRALDAAGNLFSSYTGTAVLSDTTGSVSPVAVGPFSGGIWSGQVTVGVAAASVMLSSSSGTVSGASNAFAVQAAPTGSSYSIWDSGAIPAIPYISDSPVELGVKFRPTANGYLTALRFYRGAANPGTVFVGHLWTASGTLLAEVTFPTGTPAGWQQVNLAQPVAVSAETTYVASYHTSSGYAVSRSYFTSSNTFAYTGSVLYALTDGVEGGNGVYLYGASRSFPTNTYQSGNYWVDVILQE